MPSDLPKKKIKTKLTKIKIKSDSEMEYCVTGLEQDNGNISGYLSAEPGNRNKSTQTPAVPSTYSLTYNMHDSGQ